MTTQVKTMRPIGHSSNNNGDGGSVIIEGWGGINGDGGTTFIGDGGTVFTTDGIERTV